MKGTARIVSVISFVLATLAAVSARAGVIEGTVKNGKSGDALIGANVKVIGTNLGGVTDLDGHFSIADVPAGVHSLHVFYGGFSPKDVTGIAVTGDEPVKISVKLDPVPAKESDAMRIEDIYVTAERVRNTNAAILTERQRSAVIGDGISAEQIRLSPDGTSSDALKRVTGLSIVNNKFVFVRGVTDRYNSTTLNGVAVTSTDTDADKKSFSFDLIPASMIENTVVAKTATPDLPGDFSGGLVQVHTVDFPSGFVASATAETGHDNVSSNQDIIVGPSGASDWQGKDDGTRAFPAGLTGNGLAQALPNNWATSGDRSRNNGSYSLLLGNKFNVGGGELGAIASGTYKTSYKVDDYHQEPASQGVDIFNYDGTRFRQRYLMGALGNIAYRPWRNHKFSFENDYTRAAEDKVVVSEGTRNDGGYVRVQTTQWDQRDLYLGQVAGTDEFPRFKGLKLEWRYAYSTSAAEEPDRKYVAYQRDALQRYVLSENYRTWSTLNETTHTGFANLTLPIGKGQIKTGYLRSKRERSYDIQAWITDPSKLKGANRKLLLQPIDTIFEADHYGSNLFQFVQSSPFSGKYDGVHDLTAYYGMADVPFCVQKQNFRVAGGVRVEDSNQEVTSPIATDVSDTTSAIIDKKDVLPSANLTYQLSKRSNIRLGYFKSVNRPEFREMADVGYRDYDKNQSVRGNPDLKRATIDNYDARIEYFPGVGEVAAFSYFSKSLTDAIEEELLPSPDGYLKTWFNSPTGKNYGYEIEVRKNLGFAWRRIENLIVQANYTKVTSEVEYTEAHNDPVTNLPVHETRTRRMQGQAPYTVNAGITYSVPGIGLSTSFLYNRYGRRLDAVGDTRDSDVYEEPRDAYDFALTEEFTKWMRLKFAVRDIAAQDIVYTFGSTGSIWEQVKVGTTYALSLSFNL
jgi:TonB-dependent receptor